jgi:Flp pilus assembly protein TadG
MRKSIPIQSFRRWLTAVARWRALSSEAGNALLELAIVLSILGVPLLTGTIYFGQLLLDSIIVTNAAHAGAEYGMTGSTIAQTNSDIITAAQQEATGLGATLNVTPTVYYACSNAIGGTQYSTSALANAACTGGHTLEFIQVTASATVTPAYAFPGLSRSVTLSSTSVQEVEE